MNPLTNVRNIQKLNQAELQLGTVKKSWHDQYKDSAWIFVGGLPYDLTEGDILCVFSQYGEIVNVNLVRDKGTGKSKGYGFICYEDQRSTVLAVDNLNSMKLVGRIIRVDHVENYKVPKEQKDEDELTRKLREEGCAPSIKSSSEEEEEEEMVIPVKKVKKEKDSEKKLKKKKKKEKKKKKAEMSSDEEPPIKVKKEKHDPGYDQPMRNPVTSEPDRRERNGDWRNGRSRSQDRGRNEKIDGRRDDDRGNYRRDNFDERNFKRENPDYDDERNLQRENPDDYRGKLRRDNLDDRRGDFQRRDDREQFVDRRKDYRDERQQRDYNDQDRHRRDDRGHDRGRYDKYGRR